MNLVTKLVSGHLKAQAAGPHPDPDLLSAFSENALPDSERAQLLQHLGACSDCREVLFLAMPNSAEAQKVLSFQPHARRWQVLRWGTVAASIAIVAGSVIARQQFFRAQHQPAKLGATPQPSTYAKISAEKVPAELDSLRGEIDSNDRIASNKKTMPAPSMVAKQRPEAKRMTAKPQANLDFEESGQVRVLPPSISAPANLPLNGRNIVGLDRITNLPAGAAPATPQSQDAEVRDDRGIGSGSGYVVGGVLTRESNLHGNLAGVVSDPTGVAVANAKITMVGPVGTKTAKSDPQGRFSFNQLSPGDYSIKAEAYGFKSAELKQVAVLDKTVPLRITLEVGGASETVEVASAEEQSIQDSKADSVTAANQIVELTAAAPPVALGKTTDAQKEVAQKQKNKSADKRLRSTESYNGSASINSLARVTSIPQWTLSPDGLVQRSFDLGKTWQKVPVAGSTVFRALAAVGTHIWAGGSAGTLYHSRDSGLTWSQVQPAVSDRKLTTDITHIDFTDASNGTVTTTNGEIWATSDGGQSWRRR